MRITSRDIAAGTVPVKIIENGVSVSPSLQANTETLEEHQQRMAREGRTTINRKLAERLFPKDEVEDWFGAT